VQQVLNMPFEGGSTSTFTRDYAFGNNGTVAEAIFSSTAGFDNKGAYVFDGLNDSINAGNDSSLDLQQFTIEARIKPQGNGSYPIISKGSNYYAGLQFKNGQHNLTFTAINGSNLTHVRHVIANGTDLAGSSWIFPVDFDFDGDMDLVTAAEDIGEFAWYENNGNNVNFTKHVIENGTSASNAQSIHPVDFDGDGDTDVTVGARDADEFAWYENNGNNVNFTRHLIANGTNADFAVIAFPIDFDNDGDIDVATSAFSSGEIAWYENNGSNINFTRHLIGNGTSLAGAGFLITTDFDNDGDIDVTIGALIASEFAWYENNGSNENFTRHVIANGTLAQGGVLAFPVDFDKDGDIDVVVEADGTTNEFAWYENNGSNINFTRHLIDNGANVDGPNMIFPVDFDGEGDLDVVVVDRAKGSAWYENSGSNLNFTRHNISSIGADRIFPVDFDGDGDIDILTAARANAEFVWYETVSDTVTASSVSKDVFTHVAISFDGSNMAMYQDGVQVASSSLDQIIPSPLDLFVGRGLKSIEDNAWADDALPDPFHFLAFNGTIDEVRIWNRSLSAQQVNALFNNRTDIIVSNETQEGETWFTQATPNDGGEDGTTVQSNNITINEPPRVSINSPVNGSEINASTLNVEFNVSFSEIVNATFSINNGAKNSLCSLCTSIIRNISMPSFATHTVTIFAVDLTELEGSNSTTITLTQDTDGDGTPDNADTDDDNDNIADVNDTVNGDVSNVATNIPVINFTINNSANLSEDFQGVLTVNISNGTDPIVVFDFEFNAIANQTLDLAQIVVEIEEENATIGSIIVKGINLTGQGRTKTLFVNRLNPSLTAVCVEDAEIATIAEVSDDCSEPGEVIVECDGTTISGFTCTIVSNRLRITGLQHSGATESSSVAAAAVGAGGRGGGGGTARIIGQFIRECEDGLDNDGDGMIDMADSDCAFPGDDSESPNVAAVIEILEELLEEIEEAPEIEEPALPKPPERPVIAEEIIIAEEKAPINVVWVVLFIILFAALIAYYAKLKEKSVYAISVRKYREVLGRIMKPSRGRQKKQRPAKRTVDLTPIRRSIKIKQKQPSTQKQTIPKKPQIKKSKQKPKTQAKKPKKKQTIPKKKPKEEQEALTKVADVVAKLQEKNDLLSIKTQKKQPIQQATIKKLQQQAEQPKQKPQQAKNKHQTTQATIKKLQQQAEQKSPSRALSNVAALVEDIEKNKKLSRKVSGK